MPKPTSSSTIALNRQARHNFTIIDTFEAGLVLEGSEVKSLRDGNVQLKEGYIRFRKGELFLEGVYIKPYVHTGSHCAPDSMRSRKLLMNKKEIIKIDREASLKKLAIVPLKMYLKKGRIKVEIGLGKGKKHFDKRESIKKRDTEKDLARFTKKNR